MKQLKVSAAIIINDNKVLAVQRGYGEFKGDWEFPGGKIELNETSQEALFREIQEELNVEIKIEALFHTIEFDYAKFHLSMDCYICKIEKGNFLLKEHDAFRWLTKDMLSSVKWLPADEVLIPLLKKHIF